MPIYIRFLKPPRSAPAGPDTRAGKPILVSALITITSDLGESSYPHAVQLRADIQREAAPKALGQPGSPSSPPATPLILPPPPPICTTRIPWTGHGRTAKIEMKFLVPHSHSKDALYILNVYPESPTTTGGPATSKSAVKPIHPKTVYNILEYREGFGVGVVPAYSAPFTLLGDKCVSEPFVERRFLLDGAKGRKELRIWEETGESIARHIWDGGVALSAYLAQHESTKPNTGTTSSQFRQPPPPLPLTLLHEKLAAHTRAGINKTPLRVLELGSGCGIVGLTIAAVRPDVQVLMTDLPSAEEVAGRNIEANSNLLEGEKGWEGVGGEGEVGNNENGSRDTGTEMGRCRSRFMVYDWDDEVPPKEVYDESTDRKPDIILVADCTYNPDSAAALVETLGRCCGAGVGGGTNFGDSGEGVDGVGRGETVVVLAHKVRHESESLFFELMDKRGFVVVDHMQVTTRKGGEVVAADVDVGQEVVDLYTFRLRGEGA